MPLAEKGVRRKGRQPLSPLSAGETDACKVDNKAVAEETNPTGRPLAVDRTAESTSEDLPGFLAKPKGAPVYHGFPILSDVAVDGFTLGVITDFEAERCSEGDAFVVAPDNSRAGLVWEVSDKQTFAEVGPMTEQRWGVWEVSFPFEMSSHENARMNLQVVLPKLKPKWEDWRRTFGGHESLSDG